MFYIEWPNKILIEQNYVPFSELNVTSSYYNFCSNFTLDLHYLKLFCDAKIPGLPFREIKDNFVMIAEKKAEKKQHWVVIIYGKLFVTCPSHSF